MCTQLEVLFHFFDVGNSRTDPAEGFALWGINGKSIFGFPVVGIWSRSPRPKTNLEVSPGKLLISLRIRD
jgi:hypothetical protein